MRLLIIVIIAICILALSATIGTILIGSRSFEGIVVDKPYEAGLAWDEEHRNQEQLGWKVSLQNTLFKTGENDLVVMARDKQGDPLTTVTVTVTVTRPSTRAYDRTYRTISRNNGRYAALIEIPLIGTWDIRIDIIKNKQHTAFSIPIYAESSL